MLVSIGFVWLLDYDQLDNAVEILCDTPGENWAYRKWSSGPAYYDSHVFQILTNI